MSRLETTSKSRGSLVAPYRDLRSHFFKTDRPRGIDRYIDYFGGSTTRGARPARVSEWAVVARIRGTG